VTFDLEVRQEDVVQRWLGSIPVVMNRYLRDGQKRAGDLLVDTARRITKQEDAIGATREYYEGWKYTPEDVRDDGAIGFVWNTSDHAYFAEHGRRAGGMPPRDAIENWMESKGIPLELSFPIRRAIAQSGTIKRKGYQGFEVMQRTVEMVGDDALEEIQDGFIRGVRALQ
jgi:hypothetical protein